jgi:hypothetical protein
MIGQTQHRAKHEGFRRLINPEVQVLFDAWTRYFPRCVHDNYSSCAPDTRS